MNKQQGLMITYGLFAIILTSVVENYIQPGYFLKSVFKVIIFFGGILGYCFLNQKSIKEVLYLKKLQHGKHLLFFLLLGYLTIVVVFFLFRNLLDLQNIKEALLAKEKMTAANCLPIFVYIMICNSFIEESFFRGFLFKGLSSHKPTAYVVSSLFFALYHIGIVNGWFQPALFVLCIVALALCGMVLDFVVDHFDSLLASYFVHALANLAINTIGIYLVFFY